MNFEEKCNLIVSSLVLCGILFIVTAVAGIDENASEKWECSQWEINNEEIGNTNVTLIDIYEIEEECKEQNKEQYVYCYFKEGNDYFSFYYDNYNTDKKIDLYIDKIKDCNKWIKVHE